MRMSVRTNLLLPEDVVAALDRVAGPRGRSRYVAQALRERIQRDEREALMQEAAGSWRGHPDFPSSEAVIEWVRQLRSEETSVGDVE
jgi:hypothetical protein